jgi:hypothetical protein
MEVITPKDYVGPIMELAQQRRGEYVDMQYLTETRTTLVYNMPLAEVGTCALVCVWQGCRGGYLVTLLSASISTRPPLPPARHRPRWSPTSSTPSSRAPAATPPWSTR